MCNENKCGCHDEEKECGCHTGEGCGCDQDNAEDGCGCGEHEDFVIDLEDDNGNVISCPIIDDFEFENNEYILAQHPDEDSVYLFRYTEEDELIVPEEEEFDRVAKYYSEELIEE